jgi:hypothetical protein
MQNVCVCILSLLFYFLLKKKGREERDSYFFFKKNNELKTFQNGVLTFSSKTT